jgi:hypothetical protein
VETTHLVEGTQHRRYLYSLLHLSRHDPMRQCRATHCSLSAPVNKFFYYGVYIVQRWSSIPTPSQLHLHSSCNHPPTSFSLNAMSTSTESAPNACRQTSSLNSTSNTHPRTHLYPPLTFASSTTLCSPSPLPPSYLARIISITSS